MSDREDSRDIDARFAELVAQLESMPDEPDDVDERDDVDQLGDVDPRGDVDRRDEVGAPGDSGDVDRPDDGDRPAGHRQPEQPNDVRPQPGPAGQVGPTGEAGTPTETSGRGSDAGAGWRNPRAPSDGVNPPPPQPAQSIQLPDQGWRSWSEPEVEEHYIPPPPPPLPAGDLHLWGIVIGLLGGPLLLLLTLFVPAFHDSTWKWVGVLLGVVGVVLLVLRLPRQRDDDPTGGARV